MGENKIFEPQFIVESAKTDKPRMTESENYVKENLKDFENVEIKKLSELPYWNKINNFLAFKGILDREVIIIDDEKKWKSVYGSNDSKSSHKPKAVLLKKEVFDRKDISDENISWLVHEVGHIDFYNKLGEKLEDYMEKYYVTGKYTESEMEQEAFKLQFEFLKSIGKSKNDCVIMIEKYLSNSFFENQKEEKNKELEHITKYIENVY